jgi:Right handed beta helix region
VVLDSAGYAPVAIDRSVSIIAPAGVYAGITAFSGDGVAITGSSLRVALRGLTINSQGGQSGIHMLTGFSKVMVERVFVSGFAIGIDMAVGGVGSNNRLDVEDTIVRGNGNGVEVAGQNEVSLDRVRVAENTEWGVWVATGASAHIRDSVIERNGNFGVVIDSFGAASGTMLLTIERSTVRGSAVTAGIKLFSRLSAADIRASVSNSVVSQNSTGIEATCQDASLAAATVSDSTVWNNSSEGIVASGASCAVAASHNVISGNGGASMVNAGAGSFVSFGDNRIYGNSPDTPSGTITLVPSR